MIVLYIFFDGIKYLCFVVKGVILLIFVVKISIFLGVIEYIVIEMCLIKILVFNICCFDGIRFVNFFYKYFLYFCLCLLL